MRRIDKITWIVIDDETGEVISEERTKVGIDGKLTKGVVDNMLTNAIGASDIDVNMLYAWCKITKAINKYGQIQTFGNKLNSDIEDLLLEEGIVCSYVLKAIKMAHPFSGILKVNHKAFISTWKELYEEIGCPADKRMQKKIKTFLVGNGLIDMFKLSLSGKDIVKRLILNPYLYKGASHSGQIACILWQGYAKENINVNIYAYRWLQGMGYIQ